MTTTTTTLIDEISKTVYFIDIAIANNHNLHAKYAEKLEKYSELSIIIPITLSTNGIIPKTLHKALNTLNLHPNTIIELRKLRF
jgi:hypothetical protein